MKVRQDAWSHEDDVYLAETVLRHIREGSTQLRAFDEVGDELNRTSAACGFRWNAVVRQKYVEPINQAKKERKQLKRAHSLFNKRAFISSNSAIHHGSMSLSAVIEFLQQLQHTTLDSNTIKSDYERLLDDQHTLIEKNRQLQQQLTQLKKDHSIIEEDYQSLIQIMNRARRMAILQDDDSLSTSTFRMDKNGNLEKLAK